MDTSLIILTYNDGKRTLELVKKIHAHRAFDHIILVDNDSTDDTAAFLNEAKNEFPEKITVLKADENGGYAKGNNFGIRYAIERFRSDHIFVANPDTYFTDKTALAMISAQKRHPSYGVLAPVVEQGYNVWDLPGFWGVVESLFLISFNIRKRAVKKALISSGHTLVQVGVVEGSFFLISKEAFEKINGLDERTFIYGEEIMLARRLKLQGFKVGVLTKERYDHLHSATIKKLHNNSKTRTFKYFHDSFSIYNRYYLHTNALQDLIFEAACNLARFERVIYDRIMRIFQEGS